MNYVHADWAVSIVNHAVILKICSTAEKTLDLRITVHTLNVDSALQPILSAQL